ncbi:hypothetical protein [Lysinibacillus antri]|uniref:Uncharacterized protein n=1 Tax=Lysinibacillus antri TaxID=2498145 RepID=A0A432LFR1_9BACI|nr:hypothetical protein [Lysinibacillus antri]RUL56491.1 hypothetical protein EK386_02345 [Lysinibacillus antri]
MQVENPMVLGRIEHYSRPRLVVIDTCDKNDFENPTYDIFESFIASNDDYYVFGEHVVHMDNLPRYFEDYLKAECRVKK